MARSPWYVYYFTGRLNVRRRAWAIRSAETRERLLSVEWQLWHKIYPDRRPLIDSPDTEFIRIHVCWGPRLLRRTIILMRSEQYCGLAGSLEASLNVGHLQWLPKTLRIR